MRKCSKSKKIREQVKKSFKSISSFLKKNYREAQTLREQRHKWAAAVLVEMLHVSTSWRSRSEEEPDGTPAAAEPRSSPRRTEAADRRAASSERRIRERKLPQNPLRPHRNLQVSLIYYSCVIVMSLVQFTEFNVCSWKVKRFTRWYKIV